jgi:phosphoglycerate dehydrogenase-like enzyme
MVADDVVVFVQGTFDDDDVALIRAVPGVRAEFFADQEKLEARIDEAQVVAGQLSAVALARAEQLKWVQSWAAGPDSALYPEMVASPVILTCCKGNGGVPLAEHAMMLMMMLNTGAVQWLDAQHDREWRRHVHPELNGQTCGIIGLGHSGADLAAKAQSFHMRVIGVRRTEQPTAGVDVVLTRERLPELLAESDFVVVTAPFTPETAGLLGEREFQLMKPTASVVCISRGGIIQEDALLKALQQGQIAGAGLDALGTEPLPADSPLWDAPNTIVTPHNGATTRGTQRRGLEIFIDNLRRFAAGDPLHNVVDKAAGY